MNFIPVEILASILKCCCVYFVSVSQLFVNAKAMDNKFTLKTGSCALGLQQYIYAPYIEWLKLHLNALSLITSSPPSL